MQGNFKYIPTLVGAPWFDSKKGTIPCMDGAGTVVALGCSDSKYVLGDEVVFDNGARMGTCAEYVCVPETQMAKKPKELSFADCCATIGLASGTAVTCCDWMLSQIKHDEGASLKFVVLGGAGGVG